MDRVKKNMSVWLRDDGTVWKDRECRFQIIPLTDINGYKFLKDSDLGILADHSTIIYYKDEDGETIETVGKYLHRMMVFSFGDCNGAPYNSRGWKSVIDHLDMDHGNNAVSNLEQISQGLNLYRAYKRIQDPGCYRRYQNYYNSLTDEEKSIVDEEIRNEDRKNRKES